MPCSVAGLAGDVLAALDEFFRDAAICRQGEFAFLVIAGELLPFGDESFSVVVVARLEKNTGDDYGEECAEEEGDDKAVHGNEMGRPRGGGTTAGFWVVRAWMARCVSRFYPNGKSRFAPKQSMSPACSR